MDRLTTADLKDLQEAVRRLDGELKRVKARIKDHARARGGPIPTALLEAETRLRRVREALGRILDRHPEAVAAMGAAEVRRYRKRTPRPAPGSSL